MERNEIRIRRPRIPLRSMRATLWRLPQLQKRHVTVLIEGRPGDFGGRPQGGDERKRLVRACTKKLTAGPYCSIGASNASKDEPCQGRKSLTIDCDNDHALCAGRTLAL